MSQLCSITDEVRKKIKTDIANLCYEAGESDLSST